MTAVRLHPHRPSCLRTVEAAVEGAGCSSGYSNPSDRPRHFEVKLALREGARLHHHCLHRALPPKVTLTDVAEYTEIVVVVERPWVAARKVAAIVQRGRETARKDVGVVVEWQDNLVLAQPDRYHLAEHRSLRTSCHGHCIVATYCSGQSDLTDADMAADVLLLVC
jgi:hypothetical protein